LTRNGRHYRFSYRPLLDKANALSGLLVIVADVTAECERQRLELEQKETLNVLGRIVDDKAGFLEFLGEADDLLGTVSDPPPNGLPAVKRALHTLKGNCMTFGVGTIADLCHRLESSMVSEDRPPTSAEIAELSAAWQNLKRRLSTLLGERGHTKIEIEPERLHALLGAALDGRPRGDLARMIADLRLEPTAGRLRRVGEHARRIAKRLNKGNVDVQIDDAKLLLDAERWSSFWSVLTHVVRNALDHGIETLEVRERTGKAGEGSLKLRTYVDGPDFVVAIEDDGRGIAWERVRERAREAGLPHESRADLKKALFVEGISTVDEVTEFSGRGIGLAAVRAACEERGGSIAVESEPGRGTSFVFRFPRESMSLSPEEYLLAGSCAGGVRGRAA
jgi:two-component system chemotaxis sensor kinase CheA